jgi:hypothetical protein
VIHLRSLLKNYDYFILSIELREVGGTSIHKGH